MRRLFLLSILAIAVVGCAESSIPATTSPLTVAVTPAGPLAIVPGGRLSLFKDDSGKEDLGELSVGDPSSAVDKIFPSGTATVSRELPKPFDKDYSGESFDENGSGFGVIYYRGPGSGLDTPVGGPVVAMAMKYETGLNQADVDSTVQAYIAKLGKPTNTLTGPIATYNFWEDTEKEQRLMICSVLPRKDGTKLNMTVAVGNVTVMDKLAMDFRDARKDSAAVQPLQQVAPG